MTALVTTRAELAAARTSMPGPVAVVMTMGALHEGHATLLRAARAGAERVIATIFVNPLQFGAGEDFGRYPRTLADDVALCSEAGVDLVFAPSVDEVYPHGEPSVRVAPGPLATVLEGAHRPGHFDGVLTVVLKLLLLTRSDQAYFGEKDFQQLALVTAMVADLDVPVRVVGVPTRRDPDGLALSSRNRYLTAEDREAALGLSRGLRAGARAARDGAGVEGVLDAARAEFGPALDVDYLALTGEDLGPAPAKGSARLLVAARVGTTRLIDNTMVELGNDVTPVAAAA